MKHDSAGLSAKVLLRLIAILAVLSLSFPVVARAFVYDNFAGSEIDQNKWTATGAGFYQLGDGYLYYRGITPANESLVSKSLYTWGTFTMPFADYSSNNGAPPAQGLGSVVALGLGSQESGAWVRIERGQVVSPQDGYIEVNWRIRGSDGEWGKIHVNYLPSNIISGELQLRYDGVHVTFYYRTSGTDPWTQMVITGQGGLPPDGQVEPLIITPNWETAVPMFVQAIPGGAIDTTPTYALSFKVESVSVKGLYDLIATVKGLEVGYFRKPSLQKILTNKLTAVGRMLNQRLYADALDKLEKDILKKTDGCSTEKGRADKNDWITDCVVQDQVYQAIVEVMLLLQGSI
jgi:hypothetical protein